MTDSSLPTRKTENSQPSLGKRLFSRINDVLAICIVLFAGISMGDSVIQWWNRSPEEAHQPRLQAAADDITPPDFLDGSPVRIDAGNLNVQMERSTFRGSQDEVHQQMVERLARIAMQQSSLLEPPSKAELSLLGVVRNLEPIWSGDAVAVYHQAGPLGAYVAVRENSADQRNAGQYSGPRVVSWGFVVAEGDSRWTVWLLLPRVGQGRFAETADWRDVLPEGAMCDLGLHARDGQLMLTYSGTGDLTRWKQEFEQALQQRDFQLTSEWSDRDSQTSAEFEYSDPVHRQQLTLYIQNETDDRLRGMLHVTRLREETP